ncbi:MAG: hypothetical protein KA354_24460 [Phycisphaerae bacterium]|jgi:hypothetical protein|nr:hypothetical protein [Phycisphaerae bacterium]
MTTPWFDPETGALRLDEYVVRNPSFQAIMADGVVTDEELAAQSQRTLQLLRDLDGRLPDALRDLATEALVEMAVLHAVQLHRTRQSLI